MTEPDTPDSDPIGYRMADPCLACGDDAATRRDNGECYECNTYEAGGEPDDGPLTLEEAILELDECPPRSEQKAIARRLAAHYEQQLASKDSESADVPSPPQSPRATDAAAPGRRVTAGGQEPVTAQAHYTASDIEPIDVIEAWGLSFHLGNVVKYIARHKGKGGRTDLIKALSYLHREIHGEWPSE